MEAGQSRTLKASHRLSTTCGPIRTIGGCAGVQGRDYVRATYGSYEDFRRRLEDCLDKMALPLACACGSAGLEHARKFHRSVWREQFLGVIDRLLHKGSGPRRDELSIRPCVNEPRLRAGAGAGLLSAYLHNGGMQVLVPEGPGRTILCSRVFDPGQDAGRGRVDTPLPDLLLPGRSQAAILGVSVPGLAGKYQLHIWAQRMTVADDAHTPAMRTHLGKGTVALWVERQDGTKRQKVVRSVLAGGPGRSHRRPSEPKPSR